MSDKKTRTYNADVPVMPTLQPLKPVHTRPNRREDEDLERKEQTGQNNRMDQVMRLIEHFKTR